MVAVILDAWSRRVGWDFARQLEPAWDAENAGALQKRGPFASPNRSMRVSP